MRIDSLFYAAIVGSVTFAAPAFADFVVCNKVDSVLRIAVASQWSPTGAAVHGWWRIEPGKCVTPITDPLDTAGTTNVYLHVQDDSAKTRWDNSGNFFCVQPATQFDLFDDGKPGCAGERRGFHVLDTNRAANFRLDLIGR
jgi:uncharacterized membrane protein